MWYSNKELIPCNSNSNSLGSDSNSDSDSGKKWNHNTSNSAILESRALPGKLPLEVALAHTKELIKGCKAIHSAFQLAWES